MGNKIGKSPTKGLRRRAQSISWSFRYSTFKKKISPAMMASQPHMDIPQWLEFLELKQYEKNFEGFSGVEKLIELSEGDIRQLGVKNSAHRARMMTSLVALREKYKRASYAGSTGNTSSSSCSTKIGSSLNGTITKTTGKNTLQRHSLAVEPSSHSSCSTRENPSNRNKHLGESNSSKIGNEESSIYEALNVTEAKQSKSCGDLLEMESPSSTDAQAEAIALKKALEWELSLDSRDLRSHAWYHGGIPRQRAEELVQKEGEFLIRDCTSQPGNYVLTCRGKSSVLHFVINKILIQPETVYERVQYQFEDDAYDTVPDLITFYVGSGKAISAASGARIQFPCNRTYPLSFYGNKFIGNQFHTQMGAGSRGVSPLNSPANAAIRFNPYNQQGNYNSYRSPMSSPPRTKRETPPRLPSKKQRSQSLTPVQAAISASNAAQGTPEKYCSADGMIQSAVVDRCLPTHSSAEQKKVSSTTEKCSSADGVIQAQQSHHHQQNLNGCNGAGSGGSLCSSDGNGREMMIRSVNNTDEKPTSADGIIHRNNTGDSSISTSGQIMSKSTGDPGANGGKFNSHSLPRPIAGNLVRLTNNRTLSLTRENSDASLSPCVEHSNNNNQFILENDGKPPSPPPKPSRVPSNTLKRDHVLPVEQHPQQQHPPPLNRLASYHASGSDSGNGSGDSAQSSAAGDPLSEMTTPHRGVVIKNPRFMTNSTSSVTLKSFTDFDITAAEQELLSLELPDIKLESKFDLENFNTVLLPTVENKPLDNGALNTFRMMLTETGPRIIAQHLTRIDIKLILGHIENSEDSPTGTMTDGLPVAVENIPEVSGLELITLPQGQAFRCDLIERTQCLKLLIAVTILTSQNDLERAETISKWIQVAVDTKTALGNLFGFCAIMLGLCMPQIQKLEQTWHILRQKFTDSAFTFEAKLRPVLKSMNDCSNPQAPNTTVPHLIPYILLRDRGFNEILISSTSSSSSSSAVPSSSLLAPCISTWESNAEDFGLNILYSHLDSIRGFTKNLHLYKRNAQTVLEDSKSRLDELLSDAFRTEFHIKFLWGSKGALASPEDRHAKFEQVLSLMAEKFCNGDQIGSAG